MIKGLRSWICLLPLLLWGCKGDVDHNKPTAIAAGENHSMIVCADGSLWGAGYNNHGQLGRGGRETSPFYTPVFNDVLAVATGNNFTLVLRRDRTVWAAGENQFGQLGAGDNSDHESFVKVMDGAKAVAAGSDYALVIKTDDSLWAAGKNESGQLGLQDTNARNRFTKAADDVIAVAAGGRHTLMIKSDHTLWAAGANDYRQLGLGTDKFSPVFTKVMDDVKSVSAGEDFSLVVKPDGSLLGAGYNRFGQLGNGQSNLVQDGYIAARNEVETAFAGEKQSFFLLKDGSLSGAGHNTRAELGFADQKDTLVPQRIPLDNITAVASRGQFTLIISNGMVWGVGRNENGQLGTGKLISQEQFIQLMPPGEQVLLNQENAGGRSRLVPLLLNMLPWILLVLVLGGVGVVALRWYQQRMTQKALEVEHAPVPTSSAHAHKTASREIAMPNQGGMHTVASRLKEFGSLAGKRIAPSFTKVGLEYPPPMVTFVVLKDKSLLEVYARASTEQPWGFVRRYPLVANAGRLGPKLVDGDKQVPEGLYRVDVLDPDPGPQAHVALRLNYPNEFDRKMAKLDERTNLGGFVMIQGGTLSEGNLVMGDATVEELFALASQVPSADLRILIVPSDFRRNSEYRVADNQPKWVTVLYGVLRDELAAYPLVN